MKIKHIQMVLNKEKLPDYIVEITIEKYVDHMGEKSALMSFVLDEKIYNNIDLPQSDKIKMINNFKSEIHTKYFNFTNRYIYTKFQTQVKINLL